MQVKEALKRATNPLKREGYSKAKPIDLRDFELNGIKASDYSALDWAANIARTRVLRSRGAHLITQRGEFRVHYSRKGGYAVSYEDQGASVMDATIGTDLAEIYTEDLNSSTSNLRARRTLRRPGYTDKNPFIAANGKEDWQLFVTAAALSTTRRWRKRAHLVTSEAVPLEFHSHKNDETPQKVTYDVVSVGTKEGDKGWKDAQTVARYLHDPKGFTE